jgi:hypothetical protein
MKMFDFLKKKKVFCIGRNKTGTTSLQKALQDLGYKTGNQRSAEMLLGSYKSGDFQPLIRYCKSADAFQDFPFSYPETYKYLDKAFPGSKFILTVRDSAEQWYDSITKFHTRLFGKGNTPSVDDLKNAEYVWKGWMWECNRILYNTPESEPYKKDILLKHYNDYNSDIIEFFKDRPQDLLILNLSESGSFNKFLKFLNKKSSQKDFPWENKTDNIKIRR